MKLALVVVCCLAASASAQTDLPPIISNGLDAYQKTDGKAALAAWLKGSPVENDTTTKMQVNGLLAQIEAAYGKMIGSETLRVVTLSPSMQRVYLLIKFEKGPLYASFDCYKSPTGWIVPICDFNTKANTILPAGLLAGSSK